MGSEMCIRDRGGKREGMKVTVCELPDDRAEFASEWERLARHVRKESANMVLLPETPFMS